MYGNGREVFFENNSEVEPLVSVVIPAYNSAKYIKETLESVLRQTYKNLEIILVDDGSTDDTSLIASEYKKYVKYYYQENKGPGAARNFGVNNSNGNYIAFLDSDDVWVPNHIKIQVQFLEKNKNVSVVYGKLLYWKKNSSGEFPDLKNNHNDCDKFEVDPELSGWMYTKMLFGSHVPMNTVVIRRSLFFSLKGFNVDMPRGEDFDFWMRASRLTEFAKDKNIHGYYRLHDSSITASPPAQDYFFQVVEKAVNTWGAVGPDGTTVNRKKLKKNFGKIRFNYGYSHYYRGCPGLAFSAFKDSIQYNPTHIKSWIYTILSFFKKVSLR